MKRILIVLLATALLGSCHNQYKQNSEETDSIITDSTESVIHADIAYHNFDEIKSLTVFFDSICAKHPLELWSDDENVNESFMSCVAAIEKYRCGKSVFFPDSMVHKCIGTLGFNLAIIANHGVECTDLSSAEWFMMCAAYYTPDITCLVETQTPDHKAGYINFGNTYNSNPWWPYAFLKRKKGFEVIHLGDDIFVNAVYHLTDEHNRTYYLFSDHHTPYFFNQWLFMSNDEDSMVKVAEYHEAPGKNSTATSCYYFDKKNLVWKYAKEDEKTGKLVAVEENPALSLILDGNNSRFAE